MRQRERYAHLVEAGADEVEQRDAFSMACMCDKTLAASLQSYERAAAGALPEPLRGADVAIVAALYAGPAGEGERALQPVREFGEPLAEKQSVVHEQHVGREHKK